MKALVVRVQKGSVDVAGLCVACIRQGLIVFVGIERGDTRETSREMAEKVIHVRIFEDDDNKMNHSLLEKNYSLLCIPNFTLCADGSKGRRPSFESAMPKNDCEPLFKHFVAVLREQISIVEVGIFGALMRVNAECDGPVNIILEVKPGYTR